ncbi:MAG: ATP synthase subunit I [Nitrospirae bacterium]|nr:ATP synthase subunit I [Nitrospirota bacterium]
MDLIKKIVRRSAIILMPVAAASAVIEWWRVPAGILAGGLIALVNIKLLAWGVSGLLGAEKATARMLFFSQFRFLMILVILSLLVYLRLVNIFGILAGFSIVFSVVMAEGYLNSRQPGKGTLSD